MGTGGGEGRGGGRWRRGCERGGGGRGWLSHKACLSFTKSAFCLRSTFTLPSWPPGVTGRPVRGTRPRLTPTVLYTCLQMELLNRHIRQVYTWAYVSTASRCVYTYTKIKSKLNAKITACSIKCAPCVCNV